MVDISDVNTESILEKIVENHQSIPDMKELLVLYKNAKFYMACGETIGSLVSYSCASVLIHSCINRLESSKHNRNKKDIDDLNDILSCCLTAVNELQTQANSLKAPAEKRQDDEEEKEESIIVIDNVLKY